MPVLAEIYHKNKENITITNLQGNYTMLWVWYPPTLIWAEVLIIGYIFLWIIIRKNETND